jgi:hypothetical protein
VEDITYARSQSATDDYRLLGNILGVEEYYKLTGITTYAILVEPMLYNLSINNTMPTHELNRKEEDWIGTSSALHGSSGKVSSEGLSITYAMHLTNSTIPS